MVFMATHNEILKNRGVPTKSFISQLLPNSFICMLKLGTRLKLRHTPFITWQESPIIFLHDFVRIDKYAFDYSSIGLLG